MQTKTKINGYKKAELIFTLSLMSAVAPLSTDMYLPALAHVQESFKTNEFFTQLSLASFFIAFAFGQLIYGPLSDIFGRKKPLIFGICIFMLASLGCVLVDNVFAFIALRFLEALGGCAGVVIARAIVNDTFEVHEAGAIFALMMVVSSLAPMLSPTFGSILLGFFSWQSIFITLFLLGILLLFLIIFRKESNSTPKTFSQKEIILGYKAVLENKNFLAYSLCASLGLGVIFAYITASNFIFTRHFGLSSNLYSIIFGLNAFALMLASMINAKLVLKYSPKLLLKIGAFGLIISSVLLGFFSQSFVLYEVLLCLVLASIGLIMPNTTTLAMACFKEHSGTASALLGTMQFALAGFISFLVGFFEANTPSLLALFVLCISCFLALAYFFKIRKIDVYSS